MTLLASDSDTATIAAVIVTYNSAATLPRLLSSIAESTARVRVIVVDNNSADDSVAIARAVPGVTVIATGANLGYSGGINLARSFVHDFEAIAILNPDLELVPDALEWMLNALDHPGVGIVAPQLQGLVFTDRFDSLRREPTILGALGDSVFGNRWPSRPAFLAETMRRDLDYDRSHDVAWAGGAALLISPACNHEVGLWDAETYFLYSEETDYARRARDRGFTVRYEPRAVVRHEGSGSGQSAALVALISVNRIRYYERLHGRVATSLFRVAVATQHALRWSDPRHRFSLPYVLRRSSWESLPAADPLPEAFTALSPAHGAATKDHG